MPRKGHSPEQILNKLRQVEVAVARGTGVAAVREIGASENTYLTCPPKTDPTLELEFWNWRKGRYGVGLQQNGTVSVKERSG
jgi:hypothetical protein